MISLGAMIYIIARAAPRIGDDVNNADNRKTKNSRVSLERVDGVLNAFLEKALRRTRLILMQLDNVVSAYLRRIKRLSKYRKEKPNLFENLQEENVPENPDQEKLFKE